LRGRRDGGSGFRTGSQTLIPTPDVDRTPTHRLGDAPEEKARLRRPIIAAGPGDLLDKLRDFLLEGCSSALCLLS
jgi:hypothetical protein